MPECRYYIMPMLAWLLAIASTGTHAALVCVDSAASLQSALNAAATNGQDDQIDVVAGSYDLSAAGLSFTSSETNKLTLFGGYTAGCAQFSSQPTVLNGGGLHQLLRIVQSAAADVHIERITFIDGKATTEGGGALEIVAYGDVRIESNRFLLNHADNYAGALYVNTPGLITLRNNLFFANDAPNMAVGELQTSYSVAYIVGNTAVGNTAANTFQGIGGFYIDGAVGTHYWLSNNIFWNNNANGAVDLYLSSDGILHNNDVGTMGGVAPNLLSQDNQNVDPQFASCSGFLCLSFELKRGSPLVDAGADNPPNGIGSFDLAGKPRKIGPSVDIGAFENDVIFANGFD